MNKPKSSEGKGIKDKKLNPCKKCGEIPNIEVSFGGFDTYYTVKCKCGRDTRGKGILKGIPMFGSFDNAPQNSREEAIKTWNSLNNL